jgi:Uma2 family endonuclease
MRTGASVGQRYPDRNGRGRQAIRRRKGNAAGGALLFGFLGNGYGVRLPVGWCPGAEEFFMQSAIPKGLIEAAYEEYARQYLRKLPLSHFMESTDQSTQREITVESFALVKPRRADLYVFSELLVQYPLPRKKRPGQVVPDNMVVLSKEPIKAKTCFNMPVEPAGPFWVMEYVSKSNKRKDYEESFRKYQDELKVPYYLIYYPETQDLTLYRHSGEKYVTVTPHEYGRYPVPELDIEVALLDGWVRYWYKGELLPLPADMQRELDELRRRADEEKRRADEEKQRADKLQQRLAEEEAARRALEERLAQLEQRTRKGRS